MHITDTDSLEEKRDKKENPVSLVVTGSCLNIRTHLLWNDFPPTLSL